MERSWGWSGAGAESICCERIAIKRGRRGGPSGWLNGFVHRINAAVRYVNVVKWRIYALKPEQLAASRGT